MVSTITTTAALAEACQRLADHVFITVDTEFLRETTFWPKLCLVQVASPAEALLIDPLSPDLDLKPLFDLMADPGVVKVFHAARQDIEIFHHLSGSIPAPIFDTQVAAMVCGFGDSISYDQLVAKITGTHLDKSMRFTDWSQRPLSDVQLAYALADVTHLRDVYAHLLADLDAKGRDGWVAEEMAVLTSPETYETDPDKAWQRLKMRVKKPIELAVLKELAAWREREAQARDVPRGRILKDDAIYEIAARQPRDSAALGTLRTIPRGYERSRTGTDIVAAVARALALPAGSLPGLPATRPVPEGSNAATELLKVLLRLIAEENGVAAKVLATVDDLEAIAARGEEAEAEALKGWRREMFGQPALDLRAGRLALAFDGRRVTLLALEESIAVPGAPARRPKRRRPPRRGDAETPASEA
ncbi:ribonuclease D [Pseudoxanthobacter sp.]|uniref:ribonuclease D n=1 Tax=Pseudoxanthobacter sp. TaxID=1925742 RepID=UPI002FE0DCBD